MLGSFQRAKNDRGGIFGEALICACRQHLRFVEIAFAIPMRSERVCEGRGQVDAVPSVLVRLSGLGKETHFLPERPLLIWVVNDHDHALGAGSAAGPSFTWSSTSGRRQTTRRGTTC